MSNPFLGGKSKKEPEPEPYEEIGGSLGCTQCNAVAKEGRYYSDAHVLVFTCPEGHRNTLKDFFI